MHNKFLLITLILLLTPAAAPSAQENDPALLRALQQASFNKHLQRIDVDRLVWLAQMSEKIDHIVEDPFYRIRLLETVRKESLNFGLDPQLVLSVIEVESGFNRHALSVSGAEGLMQVMPFWKEILGKSSDDMYNPAVAVRYGCQILRHYMDRFRRIEDALAAYNGSLGQPHYSGKVMRVLNTTWRYEGVAKETNLTMASSFARLKPNP